MAVQIAVIDDWQDVARDVVDWSVLDDIGEVSFLHDYPADNDTLAARLGDFEVICVMRERTRFDEDLLRRLPKLKLLVTGCLLYTSPSPRDGLLSRMPSSA